MQNYILKIGRHKFYPVICFILVISAYLYTDPFTEFNLKHTFSFMGAIAGLICVILLTKRNQLGNYFGLLAAFGETAGNFLGGNIGAGLPHIYNFGTHIYGIFDWKRHHDTEDKVITRSLTLINYGIVVGAFILVFASSVLITKLSGVENTQWQLIINGIIFGLALPAQTLLMMRYYFSWILWVIMNVFVISLNFLGPEPNIVIGAQYCIYLFNSLYGLTEWRMFAKK